MAMKKVRLARAPKTPAPLAVEAEKRTRYVARAAEHMLRHGLDRSSLRSVAAAAGTSNRMLLYYFADKGELIAAALAQLASQLRTALDEEVPEGVRLSVEDLVPRLRNAAAGANVAPYMRVWLELTSLAAREREPFGAVARAICEGFLQWIATRLKPGLAEDAPLVLCLIDGAAPLALAGLAPAADAGVTRFARLCRKVKQRRGTSGMKS